MSTQPAPPPTPARSGLDDFPPRGRLLKRLLLVSAVSLSLLAGLRLWWGWRIDAAWEAELAAARAAGEDDFPPPADVPDDQNAAVPVMAALQALELSLEDAAYLDGLGQSMPYIFEPGSLPPKVDSVRVEEMVAANEPALQRLRAARGRPFTAWRLQPDPDADRYFGTSAEPADEIDRMRRLLFAATLAALQNGDSAGAFARLRDALLFEQTWEQGPDRLGLLSEAFEMLMGWTASVAAVDGPPDSDPAVRAEMTALIAELLADESFHRIGIERLCRRRTAALFFPSHVQSSPEPYWGPRTLRMLFAPSARLAALQARREIEAAADAAREPDLPAALGRMPPRGIDPWMEYTLGGNEVWFLMLGRPWLGKAYADRACRRMAATVLALRLHQADAGRLADSLEPLVPRYLPAVPVDPTAERSRPVAFQPGGRCVRCEGVSASAFSVLTIPAPDPSTDPVIPRAPSEPER